MNVLDLQLRKNVYELIPNLKYGTVYVRFGNEDSCTAMAEYCNLVNALYPNLSMISMEEAVDTVIEDGEYIDRAIDEVYTITWKSRHETPPVFTDDEFRIDKFAIEAREKKAIISMEIRRELFKYVREVGKFYGIKFILNGSTCVFSGKQKNVSAYKQIEEALINDLDKIEFSADDFNPQTIRVYASQFSGFGYGRLKTSVKGRTITVLLKDPRPKQVLANEFNALVAKMKPYFDKGEINELIDEAMAFPVSDEPIWKQYGYDTEQEYLAYQAKKKADLDAWIEPEHDIIKEVEGLQQYVMPIDTVKPTVEYDDL